MAEVVVGEDLPTYVISKAQEIDISVVPPSGDGEWPIGITGYGLVSDTGVHSR